MAYGRYGRGRRTSPAAEERRERERAAERKRELAKKKLDRLLKQYRKILIQDPEESRRAWGQKQLRSYTTHVLSDGSHVSYIIRRGEHGELYLQEPHFPEWRFYRLLPRYHVEQERDPRRGRSRA